jgi:hypothetical protein
MARHAPTDDEVNRAKDVLERAYRGWVDDLVNELISDVFTEDITEDDFRERVDERTDSGLIYTADQWTALFSSRNTGEAWDELIDTGGVGGGSQQGGDPVAPWAVMTYRYDVNEALSGLALLEPLNDGLRLEERLDWLIEEHSKKELPLNGVTAYLIGDVDDIGFGWLFLTRDGEDYKSHEFIGAGLEMDQLAVLMDVILEGGGDPHTERARDFVRKMRSA